MAAKARGKAPKGGVSLRKGIITYVREHPGVKLSVIENGVGTSRIEVAEAIQDLIHQGRLRKEEETGKYYPIP